jgi:hypothetical protein
MLASRTSIAFASTVATVGASSRSRISPSAFWARARALSTFALSSSTVNGFVMNPAAPQVERGTEVCLVGRPGHQDDRQARSTSVQLADQLRPEMLPGRLMSATTTANSPCSTCSIASSADAPPRSRNRSRRA